MYGQFAIVEVMDAGSVGSPESESVGRAILFDTIIDKFSLLNSINTNSKCQVSDT